MLVRWGKGDYGGMSSLFFPPEVVAILGNFELLLPGRIESGLRPSKTSEAMAQLLQNWSDTHEQCRADHEVFQRDLVDLCAEIERADAQTARGLDNVSTG